MQTAQSNSFSPCDFYEKDYFCACWKTNAGIASVWGSNIKVSAKIFYKALYNRAKAQLWRFPRDGREPILLGGELW